MSSWTSSRLVGGPGGDADMIMGVSRVRRVLSCPPASHSPLSALVQRGLVQHHSVLCALSVGGEPFSFPSPGDDEGEAMDMVPILCCVLFLSEDTSTDKPARMCKPNVFGTQEGT